MNIIFNEYAKPRARRLQKRTAFKENVLDLTLIAREILDDTLIIKLSVRLPK
jgi:hypothetical protein